MWKSFSYRLMMVYGYGIFGRAQQIFINTPQLIIRSGCDIKNKAEDDIDSGMWVSRCEGMWECRTWVMVSLYRFTATPLSSCWFRNTRLFMCVCAPHSGDNHPNGSSVFYRFDQRSRFARIFGRIDFHFCLFGWWLSSPRPFDKIRASHFGSIKFTVSLLLAVYVQVSYMCVWRGFSISVLLSENEVGMWEQLLEQIAATVL